MKKIFQLAIISACAFFASCTNDTQETKQTAEAYKEEIADWDAERIVKLKAEDGWVNLAGRYTLMKGKNTMGSDSTNDLVFPAGKAPAKLGYVMVSDSTVSFTAEPGVAVTAGGKPFTSGIIFDQKENDTMLALGSLRWFIIKRSGKYILRLRDLEHENLPKLTHIDRYPADAKWIIEADFEPAPQNQNITMKNVVGSTTNMPFAGTATFERNGKEYKLRIAMDDDEYFLVFADSTTGKETYRGGRFMHPDAPKNGKMALDFNKAYNPPCAFTDFATCPLPSAENTLPFSVTAGEKTYGH
jgi:uncharacterized protein (DUF1684 family)